MLLANVYVDVYKDWQYMFYFADSACSCGYVR